MSKKRTFKVFYPQDYEDVAKAGTEFKVSGQDMLVANQAGIIFLFNGEQYYPSIRPLYVRLECYDVVWENADDSN